MGNYQSGSVSVQNLAGCSLYRYEPCTVLPERAGLTKNRIQPSTVETNGLRGARGYSYETVSDVQALLPELLDFLQNDTSDGVRSYLQMESAYREFVYSYALTVPAEFRAQLGAVLDQCCESYGPADSLTKEQAQTAALAFLERALTAAAISRCPLTDTADGTTYQYATRRGFSPPLLRHPRPLCRGIYGQDRRKRADERGCQRRGRMGGGVSGRASAGCRWR